MISSVFRVNPLGFFHGVVLLVMSERQTSHADVIFLDLHKSGMNGVDAAKHVNFKTRTV